MHFLTEYDKVEQSSGNKFGPISDSQYRVTSKLTLKTGNSFAKVYAAFKGYVMLFDQIDVANTVESNYVNLILIPITNSQSQLTPGIQYLVYRGLKRSDIMTANGSNWQIVNSNTTELMEKFLATSGINHDLDDLMFKNYSQYANFNSNNPSTKTNIPLSEPLYNYYSQYCAERFAVDEGTHIGQFDTEGLGIDVVTFEYKFRPNMNFAHQKETIFDVSDVTGYNSSHNPGNESASVLAFRERIHNFIDLAVLYSIHQEVKVTYHENDNKQLGIGGQQLYDKLICVFATKNTIYFDIRNNNDYSLNFYQDYQNSNYENLNLKVNNDSEIPKIYYTNKWPILILNQQIGKENCNYTEFGLRFFTTNNQFPLAYIDFAYLHTTCLQGKDGIISEYNFPISGQKFLPLKLQDGNLTEATILVVPSYNDATLNGNYAGAWLNRIYYLRNGNFIGTPPARLVVSDSVFDNIFGYLTDLTVAHLKYSTNHSPSKTIWRLGLAKRFIRKGEGNLIERMVQIGVGIAPNDVSFFAIDIARNLYYNPLNSQNAWEINLACYSSGDSKFEEYKKSFTQKTNTNFIKVNSDEGAILSLEQGFNPDSKNNPVQNFFYSLNLTRDEILEIQGCIATSNLVTSNHTINFAFDTNSKEKDSSGFYYGKGRLVITGQNINGQYTKITSLSNDGNLFILSRDGVTYSTVDSAANSMTDLKIKQRDPNQGVFTVTEYVNLVKEVEIGFKKLNGNEFEDIEITISRLRKHYYGRYDYGKEPQEPKTLLPNPFEKAIPNSPINFGLFTIGNENIEVGAFYLVVDRNTIYKKLISRADENGIEDNPSPYIIDPENNKIDIGHVFLGLDGLISDYYSTGGFYNSFQIFRNNDLNGFVADVGIAAAEARLYDYDNTKPSGFYYPESKDLNRLYEISAPTPDLLSDVDHWGIYNAYKYFKQHPNSLLLPLKSDNSGREKLTLSFLLDYYYKNTNPNTSQYPQQYYIGGTSYVPLMSHYKKRFTNFCVRYDCNHSIDKNNPLSIFPNCAVGTGKPEEYLTHFQGLIRWDSSQNKFIWNDNEVSFSQSIDVIRRRMEIFCHFWFQKSKSFKQIVEAGLYGYLELEYILILQGDYVQKIDILAKGTDNSPVRFERNPLSNQTNKSIYDDLSNHIGDYTNSDDLAYVLNKFINWMEVLFKSE